MIYSMTAFARAQNQSNLGNLVCEIRSINHRYLEMSIYLPETLRTFEMPMRERIRQFVKRGKIECSIRYQPSETVQHAELLVNTALVKELCKASELIASFLKNPAPIHAADIMRYPNVLLSKEGEIDQLKNKTLQLVDETLQQLCEVRNREGEELKQLFMQRLSFIQIELQKVRERFPDILTDQKERLRKRFAEAKIELDKNRLEQEMLMFTQKIDIAEEVERIETHLAESHRILIEGGMVGRRLDFLLQELNREANTLGSKSLDSVTTHAAVEMKVLIEQMREQVQNVE